MRLVQRSFKRTGGSIVDIVHQDLRGAAHYAADKAVQDDKRASQAKIQSVGLGRLAGAVDATSSLKLRRTNSDNAFGAVFARRRRGVTNRGEQALLAYSEGASIYPVKGSWLWYPTKAIPARAGRYKMTVEGYIAAGFEGSIGKLDFVQTSSRRAMLIVHNVDISNRTGVAKARGKRRSAARTQKRYIVAFWGIKFTARAQRYDQDELTAQAALSIPRYAEEYQSRSSG